MIRSDFHEIEQRLLDRISRLTHALNDIAASEPIPTPIEGWQFCRDVARDTLSELSEQDALSDSSPDRLTAASLDPETPECSICGARVFEPCRTLERAKNCQLPPGTSYTSPYRMEKP